MTNKTKTAPATQTGKRGLCGSGMANNLNKGARMMEDIVNAYTMYGHTYDGDEGQAFVEAAIAATDALEALALKYQAYANQGTNDLDPLPNNGARIVGRMKGQAAILSTFITVEPTTDA